MSDRASLSFSNAGPSASDRLASETVGLVSKEEFTRRREALESEERRQAEEAAASAGGAKKKKKKKAKASTLSFGDELDEEEGDESSEPKRPKLGKNPNVDTEFLPDKDREEALERKKAVLAAEWERGQDAIKAEEIEITYSWWDPSASDGKKGHRHTVTVKKGFSIEQFIDAVRHQVPALRSFSSDGLMYVKEDLILPHNLTFYELIVNKARGKSGPLFHFDVHDDVRMVGDARVEKDESHAGKVMDKRVYERNKDKFPYSRFEVYDPRKSYDTYTVHGSETYGDGVNVALPGAAMPLPGKS